MHGGGVLGAPPGFHREGVEEGVVATLPQGADVHDVAWTTDRAHPALRLPWPVPGRGVERFLIPAEQLGKGGLHDGLQHPAQRPRTGACDGGFNADAHGSDRSGQSGLELVP